MPQHPRTSVPGLRHPLASAQPGPSAQPRPTRRPPPPVPAAASPSPSSSSVGSSAAVTARSATSTAEGSLATNSASSGFETDDLEAAAPPPPYVSSAPQVAPPSYVARLIAPLRALGLGAPERALPPPPLPTPPPSPQGPGAWPRALRDAPDPEALLPRVPQALGLALMALRDDRSALDDSPELRDSLEEQIVLAITGAPNPSAMGAALVGCLLGNTIPPADVPSLASWRDQPLINPLVPLIAELVREAEPPMATLGLRGDQLDDARAVHALRALLRDADTGDMLVKARIEAATGRVHSLGEHCSQNHTPGHFDVDLREDPDDARPNDHECVPMIELRKAIEHVQGVGGALSATQLLASLRDPEVELLQCPLSLDTLELPHIASDGNTYSYGEIATWIGQNGTQAAPAVSPLNRAPLLRLRGDARLLPDVRVAQLVSLAAGHGLILEDGPDGFGATPANLGALPRAYEATESDEASVVVDATGSGSENDEPGEWNRTESFYSSEMWSNCVRDRDLLRDNILEVALEYNNLYLLGRIEQAREAQARRAAAGPSRSERWARNLGLRRS